MHHPHHIYILFIALFNVYVIYPWRPVCACVCLDYIVLYIYNNDSFQWNFEHRHTKPLYNKWNENILKGKNLLCAFCFKAGILYNGRKKMPFEVLIKKYFVERARNKKLKHHLPKENSKPLYNAKISSLNARNFTLCPHPTKQNTQKDKIKISCVRKDIEMRRLEKRLFNHITFSSIATCVIQQHYGFFFLYDLHHFIYFFSVVALSVAACVCVQTFANTKEI